MQFEANIHVKSLARSPPGQVVSAESPIIQRLLFNRYDRLDRFEGGECPIRVADVTAVVPTRLAIPLEVVRLARRCCRIPGRFVPPVISWYSRPLVPPPRCSHVEARYVLASARTGEAHAWQTCAAHRRRVTTARWGAVGFVLRPMGSSIR